MSTIRLENVVKRFGNFTAVNKINLTIEDKEFVVLVGPSGCGKTTILRMIAGLEDVTEGNIYIGEKIVNDLPPKSRDIAMVFQNYALYPHMNVYRNLSFGLELRRFPKQEIDDRVNEAARILGIGELLDRKPKELSGGQRQRVAMGRAIVRKPQAFLFDEPLSNLDAKLRVQMRGELSKLQDRLEKTIVYVTHDQVEAMTLSDKIVVMDKGLIKQIGKPMEVYSNPKNFFVAGFIGSPAMNFIDVRVAREHDALYVVGENFKFLIPKKFEKRYLKGVGRESVFGIRPNHIYDKSSKDEFPGGETVNAVIEVVEPIGSEVNLIASFGSSQLTITTEPKARAATHTEMKFIMDLNHMHLFDKSSGEAY